ncbi:exodeoxyribonuclease VII small subunit [Ornithinicoccus hortensis]|uniref:Exodeoxyribonuclease 7 small subunit n=1 Tax=Ornithinicoccus hortensis TaxID=82346 RepID=A0A542YPR0_9MICO|nr:exodeoxyribonuclease VII small subunit [Ornithinicoccus hortensis]TQL50076.1 exodeoxyribonuclease VII small subunit [Ornithinicoccus hortensis]
MADTTEQPSDGTDVSDLTYEQARDELVRIVARIESGDAPLEESMTLWERGEALAAHCQAKLDQAQTRLDAATATGQGPEEAGADGSGSGDGEDDEPAPPMDEAGEDS